MKKFVRPLCACLWFFGGAVLFSYIGHLSLGWWGQFWLIDNWWGPPVLLPFVAAWFGGSIFIFSWAFINERHDCVR